MCTYIYTMHKDCMHRQYQNTFRCVSARGGVPGRQSVALTLDRTIHLPDALPREVPEPTCREKTKVATRPVSGRCRSCMRREREMRALEKGGQQAREVTSTAAGVRTSILGLEKLVASTKPLDLDD